MTGARWGSYPLRAGTQAIRIREGIGLEDFRIGFRVGVKTRGFRGQMSRVSLRCGMLDRMVIDGFDVPEDGAHSVDHIGELLQQVASGDQQAFARVYDLLSSRVFGLILRVLVDRSQSEEVLQEVFLEVWQSASVFAPNRGQGRSWILTIAHRRAVDRVRASQASTDRDVRVGVRDLEVAHDGVSEQVELRIEGEKVTNALATLPDPQREAITLAYFGGYSQSEIAALVGAPLGTIKTRMRDGLTKLRTEMGVTV
jgi:RNA polymerase sigma-70 factor (ECF subfamily)